MMMKCDRTFFTDCMYAIMQCDSLNEHKGYDTVNSMMQSNALYVNSIV